MLVDDKKLMEVEKARDILADFLDDLEEQGSNQLFVPPEHNHMIMHFSAISRMLGAGLGYVFDVGDQIWNRNSETDSLICWIVIGKDVDGENTLTLWSPFGIPDKPFDKESIEYPYGHALWRDCSLRRWLNVDFYNGYPLRDMEVIKLKTVITKAHDNDGGDLIETEDRFWLLSLSEAGVQVTKLDEGMTYTYFDTEDVYVNEDGYDPRETGVFWHLRSSIRSNDRCAWYIYETGGASYGRYATISMRPCPACVIMPTYPEGGNDREKVQNQP